MKSIWNDTQGNIVCTHSVTCVNHNWKFPGVVICVTPNLVEK